MLHIDTVEANRRHGMILARLGSQYASTDTKLEMASMFRGRSRELTPSSPWSSSPELAILESWNGADRLSMPSLKP